MAWVSITNHTNYQYNNSPTDPGVASAGNAHPLRAQWLKQTNGVRTQLGFKTYTNVRKVGSTKDIGEMSKSFWDAQG